jgi:hypothetical protein
MTCYLSQVWVLIFSLLRSICSAIFFGDSLQTPSTFSMQTLQTQPLSTFTMPLPRAGLKQTVVTNTFNYSNFDTIFKLNHDTNVFCEFGFLVFRCTYLTWPPSQPPMPPPFHGMWYNSPICQSILQEQLHKVPTLLDISQCWRWRRDIQFLNVPRVTCKFFFIHCMFSTPWLCFHSLTWSFFCSLTHVTRSAIIWKLPTYGNTTFFF